MFIHLQFLNLPNTMARPVHRFVFLNAITVSRTYRFTACFYYWEIDFAHSSVKIYRVLNLSVAIYSIDFDNPIHFHLDNISRIYRPSNKNLLPFKTSPVRKLWTEKTYAVKIGSIAQPDDESFKNNGNRKIEGCWSPSCIGG